MLRWRTPKRLNTYVVLMSRGPGKIQRAVHELLESARTVEPWPVYMSAIGLARLIHRTETPSADQPGDASVFRPRCAARHAKNLFSS